MSNSGWRLYFDHDAGFTAVRNALTSDGVDCLGSDDVGRERDPDETQLAFARSEERVIATSNQGDFARIHRDWIESGRSHGGIIIIRQDMSVTTRLKRLRMLMSSKGQAALRDRLVYLSNVPEE